MPSGIDLLWTISIIDLLWTVSIMERGIGIDGDPKKTAGIFFTKGMAFRLVLGQLISSGMPLYNFPML